MFTYNFRKNIRFNLSSYQILVGGFLLLILVGTLLLMLPAASVSGESLSFLDAFFTASSAVCVTGLIVVDTGTYFSLFGQLVIITLIQLGAVGIMTLTTLIALLIGKKIQLRERMLMQEALNQLSLSGIVRLTLYVLKATWVIEFIGGTILAIHWYGEFGTRGIYWGYWHAISAFCNAGFDLFGNFHSLTGYVSDGIVNFTIMSLLIIGGLGFGVLADLWNYKTCRKFQFHTKVVITTSLLLILFGFTCILLLEWNNPHTIGDFLIKDKLLACLFQAITPRTAGYNTLDIGSLTPATLLIMIILMFIGASPASTGGGIKTTTFATLVVTAWSLLTGKNYPILFERQIPVAAIYRAFTIIFLSTLFITLTTLVLSATEQQPFLNILFEVVSAFGTVGLTTGITPSLTAFGKLGLIFLMLVGRVGPITLALSLILRPKQPAIKYPEGKIIIG